jgi:superfamily II DNA or RNA helicase
MLAPGASVRLVHDTSRHGTVTDLPHRKMGSRVAIGIRFTDGVRFVPIDQVELIPEVIETPTVLLRGGKLVDPPRLRQVLTHYRLSGRLADLIYSMEATNTDFYAFQFKPVLKMLNSPTSGLLIADEVGLGKTIEAGLIWTELRARYDARRLLVVCPKSLREKWRSELSQKFDISAEVLNADGLLRLLNDRDRQRRGFAAICSLQSIRPPRDWSSGNEPGSRYATRRDLALALQEAAGRDPLFDLLVVDEAHHMRNPDTLANTLGSLLREVSSHALFLSATPIHLRNRDLFSLLRLLDDGTFDREDAFEDILEANRPLIAAREAMLRSDTDVESILDILEDTDTSPLLKGSRQIRVIRDELQEAPNPLDRQTRARLAYRLEQANLLSHVVNRTRRRDVEEFRVTRIVNEEIVRPDPLEDEAYRIISEVVEDYADEVGIVQGFLLATPQRMMASCIAAAVQRWAETETLEIAEDDDDASEDQDAANAAGPLVRRLAAACRELGDVEHLRAVDTKYARLIALLTQARKASKENQKIIVFSSFKTTLNYLAKRLADDGFSIELLHGSISEDRDTVIQRFAQTKGESILLSSEVGSEGIDLQFARSLINYDLPWNPMRIEQRIGRIDRLGQKSDAITVLSILHEGTIDARIYSRLYQRLDLVKSALGDFEAVLGDEIQRLTRDLLAGRLSREQQNRRIEQAAAALENLRQEQEELESQAASLIAHGDYILNTIVAAHEFNRWVSPSDIRQYIGDVLNQFYPGSQITGGHSEEDAFEVGLSPPAKVDFEQFVRRSGINADTRLLRSSGPVKCQFGHATANGRGKRYEVITQTHSLTRFVADRLLQDDAPKLRPAVALRLENSDPTMRPGTYVLAIMKWSLGGVLEIERLGFAGLNSDTSEILASDEAEALAIRASMEGKYWPEASVDVDLGEVARMCDEMLFQGELGRGFDLFVNERSAENDDRADVQLRTLERHRQQWLETRQRVIAGHRAAGRDGLARAVEAQVRSFEDKCVRRRVEIERARQLEPSTEDIAVVLVRLERT